MRLRGQGLVLHEANWTTEVESRLRKFEKRIIFALKNEGKYNNSCFVISLNEINFHTNSRLGW